MSDSNIKASVSANKSTEHALGHIEWVALFGEILSDLSYFYISATQKRRALLKTFSLRRERSSPSSGIVLKKCRFGAIVTAVVPGSPCHRSEIKPGAIILDINGSIVLFETYRSIQRKIDVSKRPTAVRFLQQGVIFDVLFWTKEHGLILCGAADIAVVESVDDRSIAWDSGVRPHDILVEIRDEDSVQSPPDLSVMNFHTIISKVSGGSKIMTFVGPRHTFSDERNTRTSDSFQNLVEELSVGEANNATLRFSAIFQDDVAFRDKSSAIDRFLIRRRLRIVEAFKAVASDMDVRDLENEFGENDIDFVRRLMYLRLPSILLQFVQLLKLEERELRFYSLVRSRSSALTTHLNLEVTYDELSSALKDICSSGKSNALKLLFSLKSAISVDQNISLSDVYKRNRILEHFKSVLLFLVTSGREAGVVSLRDLSIILATFVSIPAVIGYDNTAHTSSSKRALDNSEIPAQHVSYFMYPISPTTSRILLVKAMDFVDEHEEFFHTKTLTDKTWRLVEDIESDEKNKILDEEIVSDVLGNEDELNVLPGKQLREIALEFAKQNLVFSVIRGSIEVVHDRGLSLTAEARDELFRSELQRREIIVESVWRSFLLTYSKFSGSSFEEILSSFEKTLFEGTESTRSSKQITSQYISGLNIWPTKNPFDNTKLFTEFDISQCSIMRSSKYPAIVSFKTENYEQYTIRYSLKLEDLVIPNMESLIGSRKCNNVHIHFGDSNQPHASASFIFPTTEDASIFKLSFTKRLVSAEVSSSPVTDLELVFEEFCDLKGALEGEGYIRLRIIFTEKDTDCEGLDKFSKSSIIAECSCLVEVKTLRESSVLRCRQSVRSSLHIKELPIYDRSELRVCPILPDAQSELQDSTRHLTISFVISVGGMLKLNQSSSSKLLYKMRDDLRQDELVLQLVAEMDLILKASGLDLCLIYYNVCSLGYQEGIIELVDSSIQLSTVIERYRTDPNPILAYLREHNSDPRESNGVKKTAFDRFIRSCAGYSVITYLLGIGDRHLDNLMLHTSGSFFHIDYGFIFGLDPKPFKSLLRFTREMKNAMGGEFSTDYDQFLKLSTNAFLILRRQAAVVLNSISSMFEANLPDLGINQSADVALVTVYERYRLDLDDEAAKQHILTIITDASRAVMPTVMEEMHKIAVSFR